MKALSLLLTLPCLCLSSGQQWTEYLNTYPNTENPLYPLRHKPLPPLIISSRPRELHIGGLDGVLSPDLTPNVRPNWYNRLNTQTEYLNTYPNTEIPLYTLRPKPLASLTISSRPRELHIGGLDGVLSPDLTPSVRPNWYSRLNTQTGYLNTYPKPEIKHNTLRPRLVPELLPLIIPSRPRELKVGGVDGLLSPDFVSSVKPHWYKIPNGQTEYLNTYPNPEIQYNTLRPKPLPPLTISSRPRELHIGGLDGVLSPDLTPSVRPNWYTRFKRQAATKTYVGNEMLRNNGIQNNSGFNGRRSFGSDVQIKQEDKNINNYMYVMNKTNDDGQGQTYTSMLSASSPGGGASQLLVNENNENIRKSYWVPPQSLLPQPPSLPSNPYQGECEDILDIIRELRVIIHTNNLIVEKHNLKKLLWLIKLFIDKNNLQYSPFNVVLNELAKALLGGNDNSNNLREEEVDEILEEFKNGELPDFLHEIRLNTELSLSVVVSRLAELLHRLKAKLVQKRLPEEIIQLVLNRIVQWSVPLVGYYFEQECKIRTQQYIVQHLETALDINLENVQHVTSLDELQTDVDPLSWDTSGRLDNLGGLGSLENTGSVWGTQGNIGGQGGVGDLGGSLNTVDSGNLGSLGGPGNQINIVNLDKTPVNSWIPGKSRGSGK